MKIALIGTRGIPASHGGFETCVEEIGKRLVKKGHSVSVYSKTPSSGKKIKSFEGMHNIYIPRIPIKGFETLFAATLAIIHSLWQNFNMHMVFDPANSPALLIYKIFNKPCAINTDGLGWQRDKWGWFARKYYKYAEWIAVKLCPNIVTDSKSMHDYYRSEYGAISSTIAYGADIPGSYSEKEQTEVLGLLRLTSKSYFLQVTRFEQENNPLLSLHAFNTLNTQKSFVLIGGSNRKTQYITMIKNEAITNNKIIFPGFIYDKNKLEIIWNNCFCYIHGNHCGGTNPALLQAMAAGRPVIARDCIFNREVLDGNGFFYDRNSASLVKAMNYVLQHISEAEKMARFALKRIKNVYRWDLITDQYEALFKSIISKK
jgi:glycosyltransferase involved in cell wall biosynthesis